LDEAPDVRVVERRFHLVEEVERARPREEQREEERDRTERLLAARQQRQPCHLLAHGTQLDLDARLGVLVLGIGLGQPEPALATGEERRRNLGELRLAGRDRLRETPLARLGQVAPKLLELLERRLQVGALLGQLDEALLLRVVLLLRKRIHPAERLAPALEPLELHQQL